MAGRGAYQKKAQNIVNVRARHDLLIAGIKSPTRVDMAVHPSLAGQRPFAALNLPTLKITPISLNTLKSLADELFTDPDMNGRIGFAYIDALRIRLGESLSKATATRTVEAKAKRVEIKDDNLMARLTAAETLSLKRQRAYFSLYATVNGLIKNGNLQADAQERLYRTLENHHAAFSSLFEPDAGVVVSSKGNVTKLHDKRN